MSNADKFFYCILTEKRKREKPFEAIAFSDNYDVFEFTAFFAKLKLLGHDKIFFLIMCVALNIRDKILPYVSLLTLNTNNCWYIGYFNQIYLFCQEQL